MSPIDDLYLAIEAGDAIAVDRSLSAKPALVEGAGAIPPPVHWAIYHDRLSVVDALLKNGADIERKDQDRESTPLAYAVVFGRREIAQLLIRSGASTDGIKDLALRGAAGDFDEYPDVASRERFEELAALFSDL